MDKKLIRPVPIFAVWANGDCFYVKCNDIQLIPNGDGFSKILQTSVVSETEEGIESIEVTGLFRSWDRAVLIDLGD